MSSEEFVGSVLWPNIGLYYLVLLLSLALYYFIFKRYYVSIIDPAFWIFIPSLFGFSIVLFLKITEEITDYYFFSYLITQSAYVVGFIISSKGKKVTISRSLKLGNEKFFYKIFFLVSLVLYAGTTLASYLILGIPLLAESRLDIAANAKGGMGVLTRFSYLNIVCLYCALFYWNQKDKIVKILSVFSIIFCILVILLGGSKGGFLTIAFVYFCYIYVNNRSERNIQKLKRIQRYFIIIGAFIALFVISFTNGTDIFTSFSLLTLRFLGYGDIYWMAYPNGMVEEIPYKNPFIVLFQSVLGLFRIVPHSEFPEPIGYTLNSFFYDLTSLTGANARHNVFGLVYFGYYGSIIFSFLIGYIIGTVRNQFFKCKSLNEIVKILIALLYICVCSLETDPTLFFSRLTDLFLALSFVFIISILIYQSHVQCRNSVGNI